MKAELNEVVEAATGSYSTTREFLQYIHSMLVVKNHQKIRSRYLVYEFYFTDIVLKFRFISLWLYFAIIKMCAEQCALQLYRTSIRSFALFQLQS